MNSSEILFILFQLAQIISLFIIIIKGIRSDVALFAYEPIYLALFSSLIIHLIVPLMQYLANYYRYEHAYSLKTHLIANIIYLFSVNCLFWGYRLTRKRRVESITIRSISSNAYIFAVLFIFIPAIYISFSNVSRIIQVGQLFYLTDRISLGVGRGGSILLANNIYISFLLALTVFLIARQKNRTRFHLGLAAFALLMYVVYYYFYTANRNSIFITLLGAGITWLIIKQRFSIGKTSRLLPVLLIIPLFLAYLGEQRRAVITGQAIAPLTFNTFVRGINGAFGNHENVLWLIENPQTLLKGQSYVAAVTNFVPRSIWPYKPFGGGPALKNMINPGSYVVGEEGNSSLTTGLLTEAMMNFGYAGVPLVVFLCGCLLGMIGNRLVKSMDPIGIVLQAVLVLTFSFIIFYAEFLGLIARLAFTTLPLFFLSLFLYLLMRLSYPYSNYKRFQKS